MNATPSYLQTIYWRVGVMLLALLAAFAVSCRDNTTPTGLTNHDPTIISLTAFPLSITSSDSFIVICTAADSDGDALVYDWETDSRLRIRGARVPGDRFLYNSSINSEVFYPDLVRAPIDSPWVHCYVRDGKGGISPSQEIRVTVTQ